MKPLLALLPLCFLPACVQTAPYRLSPDMVGSKLCLHGTVLATEEDGDFLLETHGKLAFVDVGDLRDRVEIGDRVVVSGVVEDDGDEGEATELDAVRIQAWLK